MTGLQLHVPFRWRLALPLLAGLLVFVAMDLVAWRALRQMERNVEEVQQTRAVQQNLSELHVVVLEMGSSLRSYLLTHDRGTLQSYVLGLRRVQELRETIAHTARGPAQDQRALAQALQRKEAALAALLHAADTDGGRAVDLLREGESLRAMDELRQTLEDLSDDESTLLMRQQAAVRTSVRDNIALALGLSAVFTLLAGLTLLLLRQESRSRRLAHQAEARAMALLEQRVAERTAELEHARLQLELGASRLRAVLNCATEAIITADDASRIVVANDAAARTFGYPLDRLVGMPLELLFPRHLRSTQLDRVLHSAAVGEPERPAGLLSQTVGVHSTGREFPLEGAVSHVQVDGSRLFTLVLRDLTEPMRVAATLREREGLQRRLLALLPDAVFINRGGVIQFANPTALRLFGVSESQLVGHPPFEFIDPAFHGIIRSRMRAVLEQGKQAPLIDIVIRRPDGGTRRVQSASTLIEEHGEPAILVLMHDVSEMREVEAELQHSHDRLRALVAAQDEWQEEERKRVSREIHDDLQQTLAAIKIDLAILAGQMASDDSPEGRSRKALVASADELADAAVTSTRHIVENLRPKILDEDGLAPAMQAAAERFTRMTGIACHIATPDGECERLLSPAAVTCLYRVFQEALNNVRKHAQAGRVEVQLARAGATGIRLRVADDGRGFDAERAARAGSFGLLGMRERVSAVGGQLEVTTAPGHGTTLDAVVPLATAPALAAVRAIDRAAGREHAEGAEGTEGSTPQEAGP